MHDLWDAHDESQTDGPCHPPRVQKTQPEADELASEAAVVSVIGPRKYS